MAQVLDEFVLEVGLDPKKFDSGRRALNDEFSKTNKSLEAFGKNVEEQVSKITEVFSVLKRGAVGILGAFIGTEAAIFIDKVALMDAHTGRLAYSIGASTKRLGEWQNMMRSVGGTAQDANSLFAGLNDTFMNAKYGNQPPGVEFSTLLARAGVNPRSDISENDALQKIMQALAPMKPQDQRWWLQKIPGMTESSMFLLLQIMQSSEKMKNLNAELEKFAGASKKSAAEAAQLQLETSKLQNALDRLARAGFPALTWIVEKLASALEGVGLLKEATVKETSLKVAPGGYWATFWDHAKKWWSGSAASSGAPAAAPSAGAAASPPSASVGGGGTSRGDRNNNPGNMEYGAYAIAHGAVGSDGRFAIFPNWETGANAMGALLHDRYQGLTLAGIQQRWVGNSDSGYLSRMSAATGLKPGDVPNLNDQATVVKLMRGMMQGEGSHIPAGGKTSSITIGAINVTSSKADPKAVADQIPDAMKRYSMLAGINSGLT